MRKPRLLFWFLLLLAVTSCTPSSSGKGGSFFEPDIEALLRTLDNDIKHKDHYLELRFYTVDSLRTLKQQARTLDERYDRNHQLVEEYMTLMCDSALAYARENVRLAEEMGDRNRYQKSQIYLLRAFSQAGLFMNVDEEIRMGDTAELDTMLHVLYCWAQIQLDEHLLTYNEGNDTMTRQYQERIVAYRDTLLELLPEGTGIWEKEKAFRLQANGDYQGALDILLPLFETEQPNTRNYGLNAMSKARIYRAMDDRDNALRELAIAADMDIRLGVQENEAIFALSQMMYDCHDYDRAYIYATEAMRDAERFNSRFRFSQISGAYSVFKNMYISELSRHERVQYRILIVLMFVSFLLVGTVGVLLRERRRLHSTQRKLAKANESLRESNLQLDDMARIREYYITYLIALNSTYADKLEDFRKAVNRKLRAHQYEDLMQQSSRPLGEDLEEVYEKFDQTFLSLYPTFINDFNALLEPSARYSTINRRLTTEQRIYSLIRIGINESSQIANFLHLSTQTIYNYKHRVRSHALSKDTFEQDVMKIGE